MELCFLLTAIARGETVAFPAVLGATRFARRRGCDGSETTSYGWHTGAVVVPADEFKKAFGKS